MGIFINCITHGFLILLDFVTTLRCSLKGKIIHEERERERDQRLVKI